MHDTNFAIYLFPLIVPLFLLCAFVRVLYVFFFRAETFPGESFPLFFFFFPSLTPSSLHFSFAIVWSFDCLVYLVWLILLPNG